MPSRRSSSSSRSRSKSVSRSSRSHSRSSSSRSASRSHSRSRSRARTPFDRNRLHISDIGWGISKRDLERVFEKYGRLVEVWQSRTVPAFAFVVFRKDEDASDALKATDGMNLNGSRIRVTFARPRAYERRRTGPISNLRCYSCNRKGHFSRDCPESMYGYKRPSSRYSPRILRSPLTRRYRSRGRSRSKSRDRRRSRSSRSRSYRRSVSRDKDRNRERERRRRRSRSGVGSGSVAAKEEMCRSRSRSRSKESKRRSRSKTNEDSSRRKSVKKKRKSDLKEDDGELMRSKSPVTKRKNSGSSSTTSADKTSKTDKYEMRPLSDARKTGTTRSKSRSVERNQPKTATTSTDGEVENRRDHHIESDDGDDDHHHHNNDNNKQTKERRRSKSRSRSKRASDEENERVRGPEKNYETLDDKQLPVRDRPPSKPRHSMEVEVEPSSENN